MIVPTPLFPPACVPTFWGYVCDLQLVPTCQVPTFSGQVPTLNGGGNGGGNTRKTALYSLLFPPLGLKEEKNKREKKYIKGFGGVRAGTRTKNSAAEPQL